MPTTKQKRKPFGPFANNALNAKRPTGECRKNVGKRDSKPPKTSNAARRFEPSTESRRSGREKQLDPSPLKLPDPATVRNLVPSLRKQRSVPSKADPPQCDDSDDDMDTSASSPEKGSPLVTSPHYRRDPSPGRRDREDDPRRPRTEIESAEASTAPVQRHGAKPDPHAAEDLEESNVACDREIAAQTLAPRKKIAATAEEILARARSRPADDVDVVNAMLNKRKKPHDKLIGIFVGEPALKRSLSIDDSDLSFADGGDDDEEESQISLAVHIDRSAAATRTGDVFRSRVVGQNGVDQGGHRKLHRSNNLGRTSSEHICQQLKSGQTTLSDIQLPSGWKAKMSKSKHRPFYTHPDFGSTWHYPGLRIDRHLSNSPDGMTLLYKDQRIDPDPAEEIEVQNADQTNHQVVNDVEETSSNMCVDGGIQETVDQSSDSGSDDINLDAFPTLRNANTIFSPVNAGSAERKSDLSGAESVVESTANSSLFATPSTIGAGVGGNLHLRPPRSQDEGVATIAAKSQSKGESMDLDRTSRSDGKDDVDAKANTNPDDVLVEEKESHPVESNERPVDQDADADAIGIGSLGNTAFEEEEAELDFDNHGGFDQDEFDMNSEDKTGDDKTIGDDVTTVAESHQAKSFASATSKRENGDLNSLVNDHVDVSALLRSGKSKMSNMSPLSTIRESPACKSSEVSPDPSSGGESQKVEEVQVLKQKKILDDDDGSHDTSIGETVRSEHEELAGIKFEMSAHQGEETKSESPQFEANSDTLYDEDDSVGGALSLRRHQDEPKRHFYPPGPLCSLQFLDEIQEGIFDADIWRMSRRRRTTQAEVNAYRRTRR